MARRERDISLINIWIWSLCYIYTILYRYNTRGDIPSINSLRVPSAFSGLATRSLARSRRGSLISAKCLSLRSYEERRGRGRGESGGAGSGRGGTAFFHGAS